MNGDKSKTMSKLLARQAQKKQKKDEEEQRSKGAESVLESDSVEGSDVSSINELASVATSVRAFANARGTLLPSSKQQGSFQGSGGGAALDKPRMSMSPYIRGSMAAPRASRAALTRPSMAAAPAGQRGTMSSRTTMSGMSARGTMMSNGLNSPYMGNTVAMAQAQVEDSESFHRGEELLAQYALQEKQRHLKKIQNDNDRLTELLKDLMETKAAFMREIAWIQMNKDTLKSINTDNIEHQVATRLSQLMDNADSSDDDQVKEVYHHLSNFISAVRANKEELTLLTLKKLEEAEAAIDSKQDNEIASVISSLRDFGYAPSATSRNLGSLISEKISKNIVMNTKGALGSLVDEIGKDPTIPSTRSSKETTTELPQEALASPQADIMEPQTLPPVEADAIPEVKTNPTLVAKDLLDLLNDTIFDLVSKNPLASGFTEQLRRVVSQHVAKCCQTKLIASVDDASVYLEGKDNFMRFESVRATVYSQIMIALTYTSRHSAANLTTASKAPSSSAIISSKKPSSVAITQQKDSIKPTTIRKSMASESADQDNEFNQSTMTLAPTETSTASVPSYMRSTARAVKSS